jgi:tetratricopeptide (TPR) repeat protein
MNNYGAKYMEKRQYDKAISSFCKALKLAAKHIADDGEEGCCSEDAGLKWCLAHQKRPAVSIFYSSEDLEENWNSDLFVHAQPIFIAEHTARMMSHSCITSIVMFNLALAHHMKALANSTTIKGGGQQSRNQQDLLKARKVYKLCHIMLRDEPILDAGHLFMIMLIVNNVGQINILLKAHEEARRYFEQLLSLQMLLLDGEDETTWVNLDGIVHNTSRFILNGCPVAAAA